MPIFVAQLGDFEYNMTAIKGQKVPKCLLITVLASNVTDQSCLFIFLNFHINQWFSPEDDFCPQADNACGHFFFLWSH